jgi:hypothetical protein
LQLLILNTPVAGRVTFAISKDFRMTEFVSIGWNSKKRLEIILVATFAFSSPGSDCNS